MRYLPLALAGGAFIVALVSLYLGSVKRADIRMIALPGLPVFLPNQERRDEGPPVRADVAVRVAVINSGARPGVLMGLEIKPIRGSYFEVHGGYPVPNFRDGELGVLPLLSGESQALLIYVSCQFSDEAVAAWLRGDFRSFDVEVSYSYLRGRRVRPIARRHLALTIPVDEIVWKS